jgi:hypothetical protein
MVKWDTSNPKALTLFVDFGNSVTDAMQLICKRINDTVIPAHTGIMWDYMRVEFWPDSGRIIAFPAMLGKSERIDQVVCQGVFADWLAYYNDMADSDLTDDAFAAALVNEERQWCDLFLQAARNEGLSGFSISFFDSADTPLLHAVV